MISAREVARELQDALEHDNGGVFGDVVTFDCLIATVQQAIDFGWDVLAEDIETLAIGPEHEQQALIAKHPELAVVDAQLRFIFETEPNHGAAE